MYKPFESFPLPGGCVAVIGSGGKTTLLRHLSARLPGRVILTTSTHIYPFDGMPLVDTAASAPEGSPARAMDAVARALSLNRVVCVGRLEPSGKLAAPGLAFEDLLALSDAVLIEADGAAGRPLKAHRPWEPVIPACAGHTICVVGASGLGRSAADACHCPALFCALAGTSPDDPVHAEHVAAVLNREALSDCVLLNQLDALPDVDAARRLCDLVNVPAYPCALAPR